MQALRNAASSARSTASTVKTHVARALYRTAVVLLLVGWLLFWGNLVRLHYVLGDASSAVVTTVVAVVPVVGVLVWYVGELFDVDVPSPTIDTDILGS